MAKESNQTIARAVLTDIANGTPMSQITASLAAYIIEEKRIGDLNAIIRDIEQQLLSETGKLYIHVTSANELSREMTESIKQTFKSKSQAKEIIIETTINTDVIGGVKCETALQRLDLTILRQLQRLSTSTSGKSV